ncbi:hypothetical protein BDY19DRAFT_50407 [Irpex rosettiformis]|uniref:Uncharacterized protein n=1 Tax=Irpex rosettiformis TaxID=378272 RepID=A0ACB8UKS8_9APHY|nr:hypothetical protein BDY19DRAFT_50407 [Irpex rosettiformis]
MWWPVDSRNLKRLVNILPIQRISILKMQRTMWKKVKAHTLRVMDNSRCVALTTLLEKFLLPVCFVHGHLGKLTLSLNWQNIGNEAIQVEIEDLYLLVVPSSDHDTDFAEQRKRACYAKLE